MKNIWAIQQGSIFSKAFTIYKAVMICWLEKKNGFKPENT
jgi:hypothetical protein